MTPFVTAAVGNEFEGDNTVGLESGSSLSVSDDASGLFGEAGAGVVVTTGKTSVYLKGDGRFAEDLYGATGRAGVRLSW